MKFMRHFLLMGALLFACCVAGCSSGSAIGNANRMNTFEIMTAAAAAHSAGRTEDAGFLFLAGQARYQIDIQVFPPIGQGGDSPGVLKAALSATIGQAIQPALANDPIAFANAVVRFAKWAPEFGNGYHPGWKYQNPLGDQAAAAVVAATLKPALSAAQSKANLVQNEEYLQLSQIVKEAGMVHQRYLNEYEKSRGNASQDLTNANSAAVKRMDAARQRMKEIEFQ